MSGAHLPHDWFDQPLPENIEIGGQSWLHSSYAFRHYQSRKPCGVRIGEHSGLYVGTYFDIGPEGEVWIGNYCSIVGAIFATNRRIVIGDYCLIAHEVVFADEPFAVPGGTLSSSDRTQSGITLGENVWVGTRAVLCSGAHIGEGSVVGAGAVVNFAVPPFSIVAGNPARVVKRIKN